MIASWPGPGRRVPDRMVPGRVDPTVHEFLPRDRVESAALSQRLPVRPTDGRTPRPVMNPVHPADVHRAPRPERRTVTPRIGGQAMAEAPATSPARMRPAIARPTTPPPGSNPRRPPGGRIPAGSSRTRDGSAGRSSRTRMPPPTGARTGRDGRLLRGGCGGVPRPPGPPGEEDRRSLQEPVPHAGLPKPHPQTSDPGAPLHGHGINAETGAPPTILRPGPRPPAPQDRTIRPPRPPPRTPGRSRERPAPQTPHRIPAPTRPNPTSRSLHPLPEKHQALHRTAPLGDDSGTPPRTPANRPRTSRVATGRPSLDHLQPGQEPDGSATTGQRMDRRDRKQIRVTLQEASTAPGPAARAVQGRCGRSARPPRHPSTGAPLPRGPRGSPRPRGRRQA